MNDERPGQGAEHHAQETVRLDDVCRRFAAAWKAGQSPRLEDYLQSTDPSDFGLLLEHLVSLEVRLRHAGHDRPSLQEYVGRFPEHVGRIRRAFQRSAGDSTPPGQRTTTLDAQAAAGVSPPLLPGAGGASRPKPAPTALGRLGDYELLAQIGRGGMGVVYRARQISVDRIVALKVIRADRFEGLSEARRRQVVERFRNEALAAARIEHDHLVTVYDVGSDRGRHFFSMRYVEGTTLAGLTRDGPLDERTAAACLEGVARAVDAAHQRGILHRDLKPANLLIDSRTQRALVSDFGLAKLAGDAEPALTLAGEVFGSPPYMSPEQARNSADVTAATDVYGLGATLYHALTGQAPFAGNSVPEILQRVADEDPVPPRRLNPRVGRDLETICLKCLEKDPARRYVSAQELADDLRRFLDGRPIAARRVGWLERVWKSSRRRPAIAALIVVCLTSAVMLSAGYGLHHWRLHRADEELQARQQTLDAETTRASAERAQRLQQEQIAAQKNAEAVLARQEADQRKQETEQAQQAQRVLELAAREKQSSLRRQYYADRMRTVPALAAGDNRGQVVELLSEFLPVEGQADLRDFAWQYYWRLSHGEEFDLDRARGVVSLAVSPDGKRLATGARDSVLLWDAETRDEIGRFARNVSLTGDWIQFSPDGQFLAARDADGRAIAVWNVATRTRISTISIQPTIHSIGQFVFTDNGRLAVLPGSRLIEIRDVISGEVQTTLTGFENQVVALDRSSDGERFAAADRSGQVMLWNLPDFTPHANFNPLTPPADQAIGTTVREEEFVTQIRFSPDGRQLAVATESTQPPALAPGRVILWNIDSGQVDRRWDAHPGAVQTIAYAPGGRWLATGGRDRRVAVWNVDSGQQRVEFAERSGLLFGLAFLQEGRTLLAATGGFDDAVQLWSMDERDPQASPPDDIRAGLVRNADGSVSITLARNVSAVDFNSHEPLLVVALTGPKSQRVAVLDLTTAEVSHSFELECRGVSSIALSDDANRLAIGTLEGPIELWTLADHPHRVRTLEGHRRSPTALCFSHRGTQLASAAIDKSVMLWDVESGENRVLADPLYRHTAWPEQLVFSPDDRWLAAACRLPTQSTPVAVWEVKSGRRREEIQHPGRSVAFSGDSQELIIADRDQLVCCSMATGQQQRRIPADSGLFNYVGLGADGATLLAAGVGTVSLFDARTGAKQTTVGSISAEPGNVPAPLVSAWLSDDRRLLMLAGYGWARSIVLEHDRPVAETHGAPVHLQAAANKPYETWFGGRRTQAGLRIYGASGAPEQLRFASDGTLLAAAAGNQIQAWELPAGIPRLSVRDDAVAVSDFQFVADTRELIAVSVGRQAAGFQHAVTRWNLDSGERIARHEVSHQDACAAAFAPGLQFLATAETTGRVQLWDVETGGELDPLNAPADVPLPEDAFQLRKVRFSPDAKVLAVFGDHRLRLWSTVTREHLATIDSAERKLTDVVFSPDGTLLVIGESGRDGFTAQEQPGNLMFWDLEQRAWRAKVAIEAGGTPTGFANNGDTLLVSTPKGFAVWDPQLHVERCRIPLDDFYGRGVMRLSPDENRLAIGAQDSLVLLPVSGR